MLKILRSKKTAKKIWITLAAVIIPAFCLWGLGSAIRDRKSVNSLGKVFGKSINTQEYVTNYRAIRNQYLFRLGKDELGKLEAYLNLEAQTWDRIILLAEARRRKIRVSNQEVVDVIKQYPFFQNQGRFNPALYRETITYVFGVSPRQFEEETRDSIIIAKLYSQVTGQIKINDEEIPKLITAIRGDHDVVYGVPPKRKQNLVRNLGSFLVRALYKKVFDITVDLSGNDFYPIKSPHTPGC